MTAGYQGGDEGNQAHRAFCPDEYGSHLGNLSVVLKDKPACLQTENASENNAKMQYAYMAYCAMRFISCFRTSTFEDRYASS